MNEELISLLLSQFIAYLISNFIIIPSYYINEGQKSFTNKYYRALAKSFIFFVFSYLLSMREGFLVGSIILSLIVGITNLFFDRKVNTNTNLIISQAIQLTLMFIGVHLHHGLIDTYNLTDVLGNFFLTKNHLWYFVAYLLCLGPVNVLIKLLLKTNHLIPTEIPGKNDSLLNAGRFIGNIERIITITLVFNNQYEAIGLFIAAKSLIRIKDGDKATSEYVLVGTLLSFGIAIMVGLVIKKIICN